MHQSKRMKGPIQVGVPHRKAGSSVIPAQHQAVVPPGPSTDTAITRTRAVVPPPNSNPNDALSSARQHTERSLDEGRRRAFQRATSLQLRRRFASIERTLSIGPYAGLGIVEVGRRARRMSNLHDT
jgi:hypothetical protein